MAMGYTNWGHTVGARAIARHKFCRLSELINFVRSKQHSGFFAQTNYTHNTNYYLGLKSYYQSLSKAVCSQTVRFPDDDDYIDLDHEAIRPHMDTIISACDLPYGPIQNGKYYGLTEDDKKSPWALDAKRAYDVAFVNLGKIIFDSNEENLLKHGVYCRESFETVYGLVWGPLPA